MPHLSLDPVRLDPFAACELLAELAPRQPLEEVAVADAAGRVLAEDVVSRTPLPSQQRAAVDGYFLRPEWLSASTRLPVVGRVPAGWGVATLPDVPGAIEVATGTALCGEGAVVRREEAAEEEGWVHFRTGTVAPFANVRCQGEELPQGELVVAGGTRLHPWQAAVVAAVGHDRLKVRRQPTAQVLVTGDELVPPPASAQGVVDTHSIVLRALLVELGFRVVAVDRLGDAPEELSAALAAPRAELVLSTGGASAGPKDWVSAVAERLGAAPVFRGLAMRPGGPTQAYRLGGSLWLALPGNPLAVALAFDLLVRAWWRGAMGVPAAPLRTAATKDALAGRPTVRFVRGRVDGPWFQPHPYQGASGLIALAEADAWAVVPAEGVPAGGSVRLLA
jgi:molybdopterin molybdotransferase